MREDLFQKVMSGEVLAVLADDSGNVLWETNQSPVAGMYHAYFEKQFSGAGDMVLYAVQAGIAMGVMAGRIPVRECHAVKMSEGGLQVFKDHNVAVTYKELIPLVKSSKDESKVCPIEQFLYDHKNTQEQWEFLQGHYK